MQRSVICILLSLLFWACQDTTFVSSVPSYPVHKELDLKGEYATFLADGTFRALRFTERRYNTEAIGYAGLLVCAACDEHYYAFDLCCPNCISRSNPLELDGFFAHCTTCGENYDLSYGFATPTKGICQEPLRRYHTVYSIDKLIINQ